jgi:hypothetical protein
MKWIALIILAWMFFLLAILFYSQNKDACDKLGGEYIFTNGHYTCQKELP